LLILAGCSFDTSGLPVVGDAFDIDAPVGGQIDATVGGQIDATTGGQIDASFVCSITSMMCPGNQTLRLLSCGDSSDCWVGCRDGNVVSPNEAAAFCTSWGGRLANIDSAAEETCVRTTINGAIILGLSQAASQTDTDIGWSWNGDGLTPAYLNWDNGQPNDSNGVETNEEQCAFSNSGGNWHDTVCNAPASARFTCRYP